MRRGGGGRAEGRRVSVRDVALLAAAAIGNPYWRQRAIDRGETSDVLDTGAGRTRAVHDAGRTPSEPRAGRAGGNKLSDIAFRL